MTKFYGIICVAGSASKEAMMALVSDQVSAFDMNKVDDGEWDWWELPTPGYPSFAVKPEFVGDPRLVPVGDQPGRCFGGPVSAIDLDAFRLAAAESAGLWQAWHSTPGASSVVPLGHFLDKALSGAGYTAREARADYASQAPVREYLGPGRKILHPFEDPVYIFRGTIDDYLKREAARLLRCGAFVTEGGEWLDDSSFGGSLDDFSVFALNHLRQASDDVSVMYLHFHC
ncbi:hypothetical protein ABIA35_008674 [Catenulispora sp. MAP12-49]|uniref:hypothetical protein n=1 Tax=Catenulispora sp. MAP12-49 TaxID=3156302 RepID=UPI003513CD63